MRRLKQIADEQITREQIVNLSEPNQILNQMFEEASNPEIKEQEQLKEIRDNHGYKSFR